MSLITLFILPNTHSDILPINTMFRLALILIIVIPLACISALLYTHLLN